MSKGSPNDHLNDYNPFNDDTSTTESSIVSSDDGKPKLDKTDEKIFANDVGAVSPKAREPIISAVHSHGLSKLRKSYGNRTRSKLSQGSSTVETNNRLTSSILLIKENDAIVAPVEAVPSKNPKPLEIAENESKAERLVPRQSDDKSRESCIPESKCLNRRHNDSPLSESSESSSKSSTSSFPYDKPNSRALAKRKSSGGHHSKRTRSRSKIDKDRFCQNKRHGLPRDLKMITDGRKRCGDRKDVAPKHRSHYRHSLYAERGRRRESLSSHSPYSRHVQKNSHQHSLKRGHRRSRSTSSPSPSESIHHEKKHQRGYEDRHRHRNSRIPSPQKSRYHYFNEHSPNAVDCNEYRPRTEKSYSRWDNIGQQDRREKYIKNTMDVVNSGEQKVHVQNKLVIHKTVNPIGSQVILNETTQFQSTMAYNRNSNETSLAPENPFNIHQISTTNTSVHNKHQHTMASRHNKAAIRTNLIEIIPSKPSNDLEISVEMNVDSDRETHECTEHCEGGRSLDRNAICLGQSIKKEVQTDLSDGVNGEQPRSNQTSSYVNKSSFFSFGGLSDCFLEEMLQEEELKRVEEERLRQSEIENEKLRSDCRAVIESVMEITSVMNDCLCHVPTLGDLPPLTTHAKAHKTCTDASGTFKDIEERNVDSNRFESAKRPFKVMPWLCNLDANDLKRINEEAGIIKEENRVNTRKPESHARGTADKLAINGKLQEGKLGVSCSTVNTLVSPQMTASQPQKQLQPCSVAANDSNDIDALLEKIFTSRKPSEDIKKADIITDWIGSAVDTKPPPIAANDEISDGDEPYDPEVEEERLQMQKQQQEASAVNDHRSSLSKRIDSLFVEGKMAITAQQHNERVEKYRQKKIRMEQIAAVAKKILKPIFIRHEINKEDYKVVLKKTVDKYTRSSAAICPEQINEMICHYRTELSRTGGGKIEASKTV